MPDNESASEETTADRAPPKDDDDAWVPLPSIRRLRGGRRRSALASVEPPPGKPEDGE